MSDIVDRLAGICEPSSYDAKVADEAIETIKSLRQRVAELEKENSLLKSKQVYEPAPYWTNPNWKMPEIT